MIKKNIKNTHSKVYQDTNFYFSNKMNEIIKYMNNLLKKKEVIAPINRTSLTMMILDNKNPLHQMTYRHLIVLHQLKALVEAAFE